MLYQDLEIPNIVALKQKYGLVANYILDKVVNEYKIDADIDEYDALVIAFYLNKVEKYSPQEIVFGTHDDVIIDYINRFGLRDSYLKPGEERNYTPIRVVKKDVLGKVISSGLAIILATGIFVTLAKNEHQNSINERTDKYFTELVSDENDKGNIVMQNAEYNADNNEVTLEVDSKVAQDIADVCNQNPDLIDIALFNAYQSYEENKLYHMDNVLNYLKVMLDKDTSCYEKISTCDVFLDYLIKIRALKDDRTFYDQADVIAVYRNLVNGGLDNPLELLSDYQKELVDKILHSYEDNEYLINNANFKELKEIYKSGGRK